MTLTRIPGKDAPLETSIETMQQRLLALGFDIIEASWLNPVPNVWSVHIHDRQCRQLFTNGKGASREAALASALGEYFERLATNYFFADYYLPGCDEPHGFVHYPQERWFPEDDEQLAEELLADEQLRDFYRAEDMLGPTHLRDINSPRKGICALPYTRQRDGEVIWFPVNLIANLYVSNGMAAGNTAAEARVQALSEILERHVKFRVIAEGMCLPDIPAAVIARFPKVTEAIESLEAAGFKLLLKDASLGGIYPVINVTLLAPDGGCFASFGAHPSFEVALERTVTELLQGRDLDKLSGFPPPSLDSEDVASPENLETHFIDSSGTLAWRFFSSDSDYPFVDWDFSNDTQGEFAALVSLIEEAGHDIYILDLEHLGVYSCRIIVPGMSEIYPVEDIIWDNSNSGIYLRESLLKLPTLTDSDWRFLLEDFDTQGFDDQHPVAALLGLLPDPGSRWEHLRVGELKCYLALACGERETALHWCNWVVEFASDDPKLKTFQCLQHWLALKQQDEESAADYRATLSQLYGENAMSEAEDWESRRVIFPGLGAPGLSLQGFEAHRQLLRAYDRLQDAKKPQKTRRPLRLLTKAKLALPNVCQGAPPD